MVAQQLYIRKLDFDYIWETFCGIDFTFFMYISIDNKKDSDT